MSDLVVHIAVGSPYSRAALLGLEEKGTSYRIAAVPPAGGVKSAEHLRRHPFGRVPVLDHGDFRLHAWLPWAQ